MFKDTIRLLERIDMDRQFLSDAMDQIDWLEDVADDLVDDPELMAYSAIKKLRAFGSPISDCAMNELEALAPELFPSIRTRINRRFRTHITEADEQLAGVAPIRLSEDDENRFLADR